MIRNLVFDAQPAKPAIRQVDPDLAAEQPLRADREHVAEDQHPDHQHRIDRGPAECRIIGRKLAVDPRQIEHGCNRADLVIVRHSLFKAERIEQLFLILLQPTHHSPLPPQIASTPGIIVRGSLQRDFCNKIGSTFSLRKLGRSCLEGITFLIGCDVKYRTSPGLVLCTYLTGMGFDNRSDNGQSQSHDLAGFGQLDHVHRRRSGPSCTTAFQRRLLSRARFIENARC